MATPFLKGSIFDDGTVRIAYKGADIDGKKLMQLLVRCMLGLNALPYWKVNSLHLRKPEKAAMVSALKLRQVTKDE